MEPHGISTACPRCLDANFSMCIKWKELGVFVFLSFIFIIKHFKWDTLQL
jgi:hypothetical protein